MLGKKSKAEDNTEDNAEITMQNAELKDDESGDNAEDNAEIIMQNAEIGDDVAEDNAECTVQNAESNDDGAKGDDGNAKAAEDDPIAALKASLDAERDRYLRLAAEYDNYRKRSVKEREAVYNDARADTMTRLLPVYDNLERALKMECSDEAFYKGVEMTMTGLGEILEALDVREIKTVGEPFDPNRHNAVMSIENPELGEKVVAEEFQKGFTLGDRVIRFSTVVVAN